MNIKFAFLGDIAYNGLISSQPEINSMRYSGIINILKGIDIVFANLEVPVKEGHDVNEYKLVNYYSDLAVTKELLKKQNIRCLSLANNHIYDCKLEGLKATIELLDELKIYHTGAGWKPEHIEPVIICREEKKYGFIAYVDKSTNPGTEHYSELYINYLDVPAIKRDISLIRTKVDIVICSLHWGVDYSFYPTKEQVLIAHELIDAGVNIIMGHHPHSIQPIEEYRGAYIFYSLGGLTYGDDYIKGRLRSLKLKTKTSFIPVFSDLYTRPYLIPTRELKGNFVIIEKRDVWGWSNKIWKCSLLSHKVPLIRGILRFNENILSRVYEYFFGYYRNIVVDIFSLPIILKLKNLLFPSSTK